MPNRSAGLTSAVVVALIAAVLIGGSVLASADSTSPRHKPPDVDCANHACGNAHSKAIHAWVTCKAVNGKNACVKPVPPGRAHAPGQLKNKDKPTSDDDQDADDPGD